MNKSVDFIAKLNYLTTEQGGRKTPAWSGYRPQVKFAFSEMQTSGQQKFLDKDVVYPGDRVTAEISIISVEFFKNKLSVGLDFEFKEGSRLIGTGKILEIINKDLCPE
jgi:translation elongation factor EF-Tu-like GTPase